MFFIHVFVKCVFISLALNNEIAKILICKSLLRHQSHTEWRSSHKMSAVAWTICLSLDHLVVETMYLVTDDLYVYFCDVKDSLRGWTIP